MNDLVTCTFSLFAYSWMSSNFSFSFFLTLQSNRLYRSYGKYNINAGNWLFTFVKYANCLISVLKALVVPLSFKIGLPAIFWMENSTSIFYRKKRNFHPKNYENETRLKFWEPKWNSGPLRTEAIKQTNFKRV